MQAIDSVFKPSSPLFLLGSSDEKANCVADAGSTTTWSPTPGPNVEADTFDSQTSGAKRDDLEDVYAGIDSLADADDGYAKGTVVEEDDPLVEFEAWLASGAVQIVEKL